jgi:hypothetical protein
VYAAWRKKLRGTRGIRAGTYDREIALTIRLNWTLDQIWAQPSDYIDELEQAMRAVDDHQEQQRKKPTSAGEDVDLEAVLAAEEAN